MEIARHKESIAHEKGFDGAYPIEQLEYNLGEAPSSKYQECLGRMTFEIPEEMEWATYDASRVWQISKGA